MNSTVPHSVLNPSSSVCMLAPSGDRCVRTPSYFRKRAGTHHSAPRVRRIGRSPCNCTVLPSQRTCSSPPTHASRNRLVVITRRACLVSVSRFRVMDVRLDSCTRPAGTGANGVGRGVCMASIENFLPGESHPKAYKSFVGVWSQVGASDGKRHQ